MTEVDGATITAEASVGVANDALAQRELMLVRPKEAFVTNYNGQHLDHGM